MSKRAANKQLTDRDRDDDRDDDEPQDDEPRVASQEELSRRKLALLSNLISNEIEY
jgi:hypothetical protein